MTEELYGLHVSSTQRT